MSYGNCPEPVDTHQARWERPEFCTESETAKSVSPSALGIAQADVSQFFLFRQSRVNFGFS